MRKLQKIKTKTSPFAPLPRILEKILWVKPQLVAQVKFLEWTKDQKMRQPVFLGLRDDKKPKECVFEIQIVLNNLKEGFRIDGFWLVRILFAIIKL